jgi:hypothetical protein
MAKPGPKAILTQEQEQLILAGVAAGQTCRILASTFGVCKSTIWRLTRRADNALFVKALRAEMRARNLGRLAGIGGKVLEKLDKRLDLPLGRSGAQDVDALARAAFNLEKTASSLSGELKQDFGTGIAVQVILPAWAGPQTPASVPATHALVSHGPEPDAGVDS